MPNVIDNFHGMHAYLSNFCPSPFEFMGLTYPTVEHAYQAMKTNDLQERETVRRLYTPGQAKRAGRQVTMRPDWENIKDDVMLHFLRLKFAIPYFKEALLSTGDAILIEGNRWGDFYWGVCQGVGQNKLGKMLMQVRLELQQ